MFNSQLLYNIFYNFTNTYVPSENKQKAIQLLSNIQQDLLYLNDLNTMENNQIPIKQTCKTLLSLINFLLEKQFNASALIVGQAYQMQLKTLFFDAVNKIFTSPPSFNFLDDFYEVLTYALEIYFRNNNINIFDLMVNPPPNNPFVNPPPNNPFVNPPPNNPYHNQFIYPQQQYSKKKPIRYMQEKTYTPHIEKVQLEYKGQIFFMIITTLKRELKSIELVTKDDVILADFIPLNKEYYPMIRIFVHSYNPTIKLVFMNTIIKYIQKHFRHLPVKEIRVNVYQGKKEIAIDIPINEYIEQLK